MSKDIFEDFVFNTLKKGFKVKGHKAFAHSESFEEEFQSNILKFTALRKKDPEVKVVQREYGYEVTLSKAHVAMDLRSLLSEDNNVDLQFSQDLLDFEPDEELLYKSKVPLWVIKPISSNKVMIQRTF